MLTRLRYYGSHLNYNINSFLSGDKYMNNKIQSNSYNTGFR